MQLDGSLFTLPPLPTSLSQGAEDAVSALWVDLGLVATEPVSKLECLVAGAQGPAHPLKTCPPCLRNMLSEPIAEQIGVTKAIECVCGNSQTPFFVGGSRSRHADVLFPVD